MAKRTKTRTEARLDAMLKAHLAGDTETFERLLAEARQAERARDAHNPFNQPAVSMNGAVCGLR